MAFNIRAESAKRYYPDADVIWARFLEIICFEKYMMWSVCYAAIKYFVSQYDSGKIILRPVGGKALIIENK